MTPRGLCHVALMVLVALLCVVSCDAQGARRAGGRPRAAPRAAAAGRATAGRPRGSGSGGQARASSRSYRGRPGVAGGARSSAGAPRRAGSAPRAVGNPRATRYTRAGPRPTEPVPSRPRGTFAKGRATQTRVAARRPRTPVTPRVPATRATSTVAMRAAPRPLPTPARVAPRVPDPTPRSSRSEEALRTAARVDVSSPDVSKTELGARPIRPDTQALPEPTQDDADAAVVTLSARPKPADDAQVSTEPVPESQAEAEATSSSQAAATQSMVMKPRPLVIPSSVNAQPATTAAVATSQVNPTPQQQPQPQQQQQQQPRPVSKERQESAPAVSAEPAVDASSPTPTPTSTPTPTPTPTSTPTSTPMSSEPRQPTSSRPSQTPNDGYNPGRGGDSPGGIGRDSRGGGGGEGNFFRAPRGFGGDIAREPDCAAVTEAKRPPGTSPRTTDRSAYLVRFRPNVSSERYREVSLAVREAPRPGRGEGADDLDSAQVVDVSPRSVLVPSAPGFRMATLWSAWGASTVDEFRGRFDDDVELIEPDFTVTAFQQPAWSSFQQPAYVAAPRRDTRCAYSQANLMPGQWNLDRLDGAAGRALDGYFAPPECLCGKNVFIYVLDTGARTTHEDFKPASRCAAGWNFVGDACGGIVDDQSGHGTHVAATALGATSGVAKCANLVPVQILDGSGQGKGSYILSALDWVAEQDVGPGGRKIVSMSVGGPRSAVIDAAVREIVSSGIVVVAAAGNDGKDADGTSPAAEPAAITVGSTGCDPDSTQSSCGNSDEMSGFSNHGAAVDVYAPGAGIRSAWMSGDGDFRRSSGTSMAAPLVTGCIALYLEKYPDATPEDCQKAVKASGTRMVGPAGKGGSAGVLNLRGMLATPPASYVK